MKYSASEIINKLELEKHPEGGFYKETYRGEMNLSREAIDTKYNSDRNVCTAIYFLLTSENFSAFHRINQDEIWYFHTGSAIHLHVISERGDYKSYRVGNDIMNDEQLQVVVRGGDWFAAEVINSDSYSLISCSVAPGFDFADFELANRDKLINQFPQHEALIRSLTRN
jgi:predicted cupin superfamily sugar epimerase